MRDNWRKYYFKAKSQYFCFLSSSYLVHSIKKKVLPIHVYNVIIWTTNIFVMDNFHTIYMEDFSRISFSTSTFFRSHNVLTSYMNVIIQHFLRCSKNGLIAKQYQHPPNQNTIDKPTPPQAVN